MTIPHSQNYPERVKICLCTRCSTQNQIKLLRIAPILVLINYTLLNALRSEFKTFVITENIDTV